MGLSGCNGTSNGIVEPAANGFYIVNEGWFGHDMGSINRVDFAADTMAFTPRIESFGNTTCFATRFGNDIYFVSKQDERLVVCDGATLKKRDVLMELNGKDGRAFAGVDSRSGVVTTSGGAYRVSLAPLGLGNVIAETASSQCGGVYATKGKLYVINQDLGLQTFDIADSYKSLDTLADVGVGFEVAKDGSVWCAGSDFLVKIDPNSGESTKIELPAGIDIYVNWGAWNAGGLRASKTENALYFAKSAGMFGGGNSFYRYDIASNNVELFGTSTDKNDSFYGASIACHPKTGNIWAMFVNGYTFNDNRLVEFDGKTGAEIKRYTYGQYWFPSMILF